MKIYLQKIKTLISLIFVLSIISCRQSPNNHENKKTESEENTKKVSNENTKEDSIKGTPDLGPNFNPVKPEIAYYSYVNQSPPEARIFVSSFDGSNTRQVSALDSVGVHCEPKWSPDGRRIAYTNFLEEGARMMAIDSDGKNLSELATVSEDGFHMFTSWDTDGESYFFFHWPQGSFEPDAYYFKNGTVERLTENGKTNRPQITEDGVLYVNRIESETPYVATKQLYDLKKKKIIKDLPELEGEFIVGRHAVKTIENKDSTTFVLEDLKGNDLRELGTVPYKKIMFASISNNVEYVAYNTDFEDGAEVHLLEIASGKIIKVTKN